MMLRRWTPEALRDAATFTTGDGIRRSWMLLQAAEDAEAVERLRQELAQLRQELAQLRQEREE